VLRSALHPLVRLVMLFSLGLAAGPALAVADIEEVRFTVTIAKSSEVADEITAEIRVTGTDLNNGEVQFPSALGTRALHADSDGTDPDPDLALGLSFRNEAELDALMPNGNYVVRIANDTRQATIGYVRPNVPSPAISEPGANDVLPTGPVEVLFTACPVCTLSGDSVEAELEGDAAATETLTESDDSWIPPDGMGGDLLLGENGEFLARITHTAVREDDGSFSGGDLAVFVNTFIQSDEVGFRTGFEPPLGDFCLVVNDPTPPAECTPLADDLLLLLDTGGPVSTSLGGRAVDYDVAVGEKGQLTGSALADLGGDATKETPGVLKGKLKGKGGELKQKLSFPLVNEGFAAKLKVSVSDVLSIPLDSFERVEKASGSLGGAKVKEEDLTTGALPFTPLGWRLDFGIDAAGAVQNAVLTLDNARTFPLQGTNKFNLATNLSGLKLQSATKGIKLQLKKVELDDESAPTALVGGSLSYKILGQGGKATLP